MSPYSLATWQGRTIVQFFILISTLTTVRLWYTTVYMPKLDARKYSDRADYLKKAVAKRRRKLRDLAIEYGGGKCQRCGYKKSKRALSFHHKDPSKKDFGLSARGLTRSWEKTKEELDKCILVCANCHMEIHDQIEKAKQKPL